MPRRGPNKFSWENARSSLKGYDRSSLLQLVGEMYRLSSANRNFLQARLLSDPEDRAKPFKKKLRAALNPDAVGKDDHDLAAAKRTMREFSQASSDPDAIADLMIYAVECGNRFTLNCGDIDEEFYDGLIDYLCSGNQEGAPTSEGCPEHLSQASGKNHEVVSWHRVGLP